MQNKQQPQPCQTIRENCRSIFGNPKPPAVIWQQQFDGLDLTPLISKDCNKLTNADLYDYWDDLAYVKELQPDLFQYLFPICLAVWHEELMQHRLITPPYFYQTLQRCKVTKGLMSEQQRQGVYHYMCDALIGLIEQEHDFAYAYMHTPVYTWTDTFNNLGALAPVIESLWLRWWALDNHGKAISALKYASGLVYGPRENPLFPPWTREEGGGPPNLADMDTTCFKEGWLPENLLFMRETLSAGYICDKLAQAAAVLRDTPESETATRIASDAQQRQDIITIRIEEVTYGLQYPDMSLEWNN